MKYLNLPFFFLALSWTSVLNAQDRHEEIRITVEPYKGLAYGAFFKSLDLKTTDPSVDYISGFDFEWGKIYDLRVKKTYLAQAPMDASSITFTLLEVISQTPVDKNYTFKLQLENELDLGQPENETPRFTLVPLADLEFRYLDEINIVVPPELFGKFSKVIYQNVSKKGSFKFLSPGKILLVDL